MGGARQDVIGDLPAKAEKGSGASGVIQTPPSSGDSPTGLQSIIAGKQKIRFHENKGEVHFHADEDGLKVALPVAEWYKAWERLKNLRMTEYTFVDHGNLTRLDVKVGLIDGKLDISASVAKVASDIGHTFAALEKFTVPQKSK